MFYLFRSRKQAFRILLGVIVAPIIITMVVTLIPGIGSTSTSTGGDTVLAKVGGDSITLEEAQRDLQDQIRTQRLPAGAANFLAPQVVQNIINDKALLQEAERLGLQVTEKELAELLQMSFPQLFSNGVFNREQYAAMVYQRYEKGIPEFEELLRRDLMTVKLRRLVTDGVTVSPKEIETEYKRRKVKARIEYVTVSAASLQSSVSVTPAEIEEHYKKNKAVYTLPERRSFQYMVIDDTRVTAKVQLTPQEIQRYYNENKERFRVQERTRVTHILFKTTEKKEDEIKKIEAKAQDVLKQARAGKDFAELAKANSDDESSAKKGGEVGWITRGQTVPEFEQKAFAMRPGEISDLVKTQYGFHIIKLLERENARVKPLAEVEPTIRQELMRDRVDLARAQLSEQARAAANRHAQNLQDAGREVGLPVFTATQLARTSPVPEVGSDPGFMDTIFAAAKGVVVGPVQMTGKSVIALVTEIAPPRQAELSEVADRVKNEATTTRASQLADARARELAEKAKSYNGDLKKAAKELKLEEKTSDLFMRDGSIPGLGTAASIVEAFTAPVHSVIGPVTIGADRVVYRISERQEADMAALASEGGTIRDMILGSRQNEAFEVFKEDLRERMKKEGKIKIYQDHLDRFVAANRGGGSGGF